MSTAYMSGYLIGYLFGVIIFGVIWGLVSRAVVKSKGYPDELNKGFLWGFFLGWIGLIVCAVKPPFQQYQQQFNPYMQNPYMQQNPYGQPYQQNPYGQPYGQPYQQAGDITSQRLAELDSMLRSGMITREEYDRRRADILSGR